jgi:HSP20 family protein
MNLEKAMNILHQEQTEAGITARQDQPAAQYLTPRADVELSEHGYVIHAELPGVDKSGLEITLDKGELTIVGHRQIEAPSGELIHREIRHYDFRRIYKLDPAVDTAKVTARFDHGVLTLSLPKTESVKPRQILVD